MSSMAMDSTVGDRFSIVLEVLAVSLSPSLSVTEAVQVISSVGDREYADKSMLMPVDKDAVPTFHE